MGGEGSLYGTWQQQVGTCSLLQSKLSTWFKHAAWCQIWKVSLLEVWSSPQLLWCGTATVSTWCWPPAWHHSLGTLTSMRAHTTIVYVPPWPNCPEIPTGLVLRNLFTYRRDTGAEQGEVSWPSQVICLVTADEATQGSCQHTMCQLDTKVWADTL